MRNTSSLGALMIPGLFFGPVVALEKIVFNNLSGTKVKAIVAKVPVQGAVQDLLRTKWSTSDILSFVWVILARSTSNAGVAKIWPSSTKRPWDAVSDPHTKRWSEDYDHSGSQAKTPRWR